MTFTRLSLLCVAMLVTAACTTEGDGTFPSDRVLTESDTGIILLSVGSRFSVKLPSSPSTGLQWKVAISNEAMLIRQGQAYYVPGAVETGAGSAEGTDVFTYRVATRGRTTLQFVYRQSQETGPPAKLVTYNVVVN
jgi:predicted secreted protein